MTAKEKLVSTKRTAARLAAYERRYRELAGQFADLGYITSGTVAQRFNKCGKPNCACHNDPPRLHGPYWLWTAKIEGRTVNKRLNNSEAQLYTEWIANDRQARALLAKMRDIANKATDLILNETVSQDTKV